MRFWEAGADFRLGTRVCLIWVSGLPAPLGGAQRVSLRVWYLIWLRPGWPTGAGRISWAGSPGGSLLWGLEFWHGARHWSLHAWRLVGSDACDTATCSSADCHGFPPWISGDACSVASRGIAMT